MNYGDKNCYFILSYQRPPFHRKLGKEELGKNIVGRGKRKWILKGLWLTQEWSAEGAGQSWASAHVTPWHLWGNVTSTRGICLTQMFLVSASKGVSLWLQNVRFLPWDLLSSHFLFSLIKVQNLLGNDFETVFKAIWKYWLCYLDSYQAYTISYSTSLSLSLLHAHIHTHARAHTHHTQHSQFLLTAQTHFCSLGSSWEDR